LQATDIYTGRSPAAFTGAVRASFAWEQQGNHMLNAMRKDSAVFFNLDNGWLETSAKNN
jgi:hypothetical protein